MNQCLTKTLNHQATVTEKAAGPPQYFILTKRAHFIIYYIKKASNAISILSSIYFPNPNQ